MTERMDRSGHTLGEALTALFVAGMLTIALAAVLVAVGRTARRHAEAVAGAETERVTPAILAAELRTLTRADAHFAGDSVRLRGFRGSGIVCGNADAGMSILFEGVRQPEAAKDSLLLLFENGGESAHAIDGVADGVCGMTRAVRLRLAGEPAFAPLPIMALLFESGTYSLGASALRYRRGAAGRQPLTAETLTGRSTLGSTIEGDHATATVELFSRDHGSTPSLEWSLRLLQGTTLPAVAP